MGGGEIREYNYIATPKMDGYRSIHFVVRYQSEIAPPEMGAQRIEIQIRSLLQHRWAAAVETVDLFTGQALKTVGGDTQWRRFFALTASLFALKENCSLVPELPIQKELLLNEMRNLANELRVVEHLQDWSNIMRDVLENRPERRMDRYSRVDHYAYLVEVDIDQKMTRVTPFAPEAIRFAHEMYREAEQRNARIATRSAVLVTAYSLADLRAAYPGYYGDTRAFLAETGLT